MEESQKKSGNLKSHVSPNSARSPFPASLPADPGRFLSSRIQFGSTFRPRLSATSAYCVLITDYLFLLLLLPLPPRPSVSFSPHHSVSQSLCLYVSLSPLCQHFFTTYYLLYSHADQRRESARDNFSQILSSSKQPYLIFFSLSPDKKIS